ncbi:hypothetical protein SE91_02285 [Bradyrhizobium sp. DOA1]|nr:hypothetical protein SE91_02285 [Bradyrhizobium sp. DOA1]
MCTSLKPRLHQRVGFPLSYEQDLGTREYPRDFSQDCLSSVVQNGNADQDYVGGLNWRPHGLIHGGKRMCLVTFTQDVIECGTYNLLRLDQENGWTLATRISLGVEQHNGLLALIDAQQASTIP